VVTADVCRDCSFCDVVRPSPRPVPEHPIEIPVAGRARRAPPRRHQQAWNVTTSLVSFVADRFRTVSRDQYAERLAICDECEERVGNRCLQCGCRLSFKARGRVFQCPLSKWPRGPQKTTVPRSSACYAKRCKPRVLRCRKRFAASKGQDTALLCLAPTTHRPSVARIGDVCQSTKKPDAPFSGRRASAQLIERPRKPSGPSWFG